LNSGLLQSTTADFDQRSTVGMSMAPVQTIAVIGGIGATNVAVNLAVAMGISKHQVLLMDGDLALGNVDCLLSLKATQTLSDVVHGKCELVDVVIPGPSGGFHSSTMRA